MKPTLGRSVLTVLLLKLALHPAIARADFDDVDLDGGDANIEDDSGSHRVTPDRVIFDRTQKVFDHFGVRPENIDPQAFRTLDGKITPSQLKHQLARLELDYTNLTPDPTSKLWSFETQTDGSVDWVMYQDRGSKEVEDFRVHLAPETQISALPFSDHALTMSGLRIAIDPGHMGDPFWTEAGGKYVRVCKRWYRASKHSPRQCVEESSRLSEGYLVLQTALLLEQRFAAQGAQVFLTHRVPGPATDQPFETYNPADDIRETIRHLSLDGLFTGLVSKYAPGPSLWSAFARSSKFQQRTFRQSKTTTYINAPDLDDRTKKIQAFQPDLVLILHMDSNENPAPHDKMGLQASINYDATKAFIPGGFKSSSLDSREARATYAQIALQPQIWNESKRLSQAIVGQIGSQLGLPFGRADHHDSVEVAPGVQGRVLRMQRKLIGVPSAYIETLYYNNPQEYNLLLKADGGTVRMGSEDTVYSRRLGDLAYAISNGVEKYLAESAH